MKIFSFFLLPGQQKFLFIASYFLCGIAKASVKVFHYRQLQCYLGYPYPLKMASTILPADKSHIVSQISRSITLAARFTPWDSSCLTQAIVAKFWCQYYDIPYFLFIGFAKHSNKPLGQDVHAWITSGPIAITGGYSFSTHQVIYSYSNIRMF